MDPVQNIDNIKDDVVNTVLNILRDQRDDKQHQELSGGYDVNPQIFLNGKHYVAGPIPFASPYQSPPTITFGQVAQRAVQNVSATQGKVPTGYVPFLIYPYVYGYDQGAGLISAFYIGMYALTDVPEATTKYTINWHAEGKGSSYPSQRIDEAWTAAYNSNEAPQLINETGLDE